MEIIGWHGGWGKFTSVNEKNFGSGEGSAQGWGFYIAENRVGGEYFARYLHFQKTSGYLHKIKLEISEHNYWKDADKTPARLENGHIFNYLDYQELRLRKSNKEAAYFLRDNGIKAFMLWETDKDTHGHTYVILDTKDIKVLESYEYISTPENSYWQQIV